MNESRKQKYFSTVATRTEKAAGLQKLCCSGFDLVVQMIGFIFGRRSEKKFLFVSASFTFIIVVYSRLQQLRVKHTSLFLSIFRSHFLSFPP